MRKALKHETIERKNSPVCSLTEFPFFDETIDFAVARISGRYPERRYATNLKCKEIVYVQEGSGKLIVNGEEHILSAGDLVLIEAGERFYWDGNMSLAISCRPAWTIDQHQIVD